MLRHRVQQGVVLVRQRPEGVDQVRDPLRAEVLQAPRRFVARSSERRVVALPSPVTRFFEGGRVSQTLGGVSKTLFDST